MQKPHKRVYRMCPNCSSPVLLEDEICQDCGHSFLPGAVEAEARHILGGKVFHSGRWIGIDEKLREERMLEQQLASGLVHHEGRWVSIQEKARRELDDKRSDGPKVVSFPVKPGSLPQSTESEIPVEDSILAEEEESLPNYDRLRKRRRVILVLLSALTFLTMAVAAMGILFSRGLPTP